MSEKQTKRDSRDKLKQVMAMITKAESEALYSRQPQDTDEFSALYGTENLLQPPYSFPNLHTIYEQSDALQECVDAMKQNIDGFGYQLLFLGDDIEERNTSGAKTEKTKLENFFDFANDTQSWRSLRTLMREDLEVLGNGSLEVIRNRKGEIQLLYYLPFRQLRISAYDGRAVTVPVQIMRDGKLMTIKVKKYFRKFCMVNPTTGKKLRWFKAFGDPRPMNADTGKYVTGGPQASEILHFKLPFGGSTYGIPRWIGAVLDVIGRRSAQFVNYDLFESQGIPPMAVMVSGGTLTDESYEEIELLIRSLRGADRWNKILILESNVETVGLEEKGSAKIELKNLSEYRKEDQMFYKYLETTEQTIRHRFRLPPLYVGGAETFTHATAKAAQTVAEEQVFIPERSIFDETINRQVVLPELGTTQWAYKSKGPQAVGSDEITKGVRVFIQAGAITVNHAIDLANRAFGLEMSKFKEGWADYPINLVGELIKSGGLANLQGIDKVGPKGATEPEPKALPAGQQTLPALPAKVLKSDMFSNEEKKIYKKLVFLQDAIDRGLESGEIDVDDVTESTGG